MEGNRVTQLVGICGLHMHSHAIGFVLAVTDGRRSKGDISLLSVWYDNDGYHAYAIAGI